MVWYRSFVRSLLTRRARTTTGSSTDRKNTPSKDGVVVWESDPRAAPSALHQTTSRAGLRLGFHMGFRSSGRAGRRTSVR